MFMSVSLCLINSFQSGVILGDFSTSMGIPNKEFLGDGHDLDKIR